MHSKYSVSLEKIIKDFSLRSVHLPRPASEILVNTSDINRPGLMLSAYDDYFDSERIQIVGLSETGYLKRLSKEERKQSKTGIKMQETSTILMPE